MSKFNVNKESRRLIYFIHILDNSPMESSVVYKDSFINLLTYKVKDTNKDSIIGYRVDFIKDTYKISVVKNRMASVCFHEDIEGRTGPLEVVFDDINFRIIRYGTAGTYSFIVKKVSKKE